MVDAGWFVVGEVTLVDKAAVVLYSRREFRTATVCIYST